MKRYSSAKEFADIAKTLMKHGYSVSELSRSIYMSDTELFCDIIENRHQKVRTCYLRRLRDIASAYTLECDTKDPLEHLRQIMTKHVLARRGVV